MIGLGKWKLDISIPLMKVNPVLTISEKDGKYNLFLDIGGFGVSPEAKLISCKEDGNVLHIEQNSLNAAISFDGMYCKGEIEIPMFGKISVNGERIGD